MGVVPQAPTIYEVLEELAITVQTQLVDTPLPFCAFNGGNDVFVDVGNKSLGLEAIMKYCGFCPSEVCFLLRCKVKGWRFGVWTSGHQGLNPQQEPKKDFALRQRLFVCLCASTDQCWHVPSSRAPLTLPSSCRRCRVADIHLAWQALHIGDRFTASGNDSATRDCCCILWVANPEETDFFIKLLLADLSRLRMQPYIE